MNGTNAVAYTAGAVACPDVISALRHRESGSWVTWWNTGAPILDRPYWTHVGQMIACPDPRPDHG